MPKINFQEMPLDELWVLHEDICDVLSKLILAEKSQLEKRLAQLSREQGHTKSVVVELNGISPRKKYPRVLPKYRNPLVPTETWSGRGKQPRWLVTALAAGSNIEDFKIPEIARGKSAAGR